MRDLCIKFNSLIGLQVALSAAQLARTPLPVTRLVISAAAAGAEAVTAEIAVPVPQAEAHLRFTRGSPHKVPDEPMPPDFYRPSAGHCGLLLQTECCTLLSVTWVHNCSCLGCICSA